MQNRASMFNQLFEIEGNPIPEGASVGLMVTPDGVNLRYATFTRTRHALKGTVIILNGRNECIEKYFETVRDLAKRGFMAATFDWRGQGGSDRLIDDPHKGYVKDFDEYVADLDQFFTEVVLPDCRGPYFILGHSTGALAALLAAPRLVNRVQRMVLCAPLIELADKSLSQASIKLLSGALRYAGFGKSYMVGGSRPRETQPFIGNKLTTDPVRYRRNSRLYEEHPLLGLGGPTFTWVNAACRAMAAVADPEFVTKIQVPALIVAAGNDLVVSTPAIENFVRSLRSGALVTVDGASHEILQEADTFREQLFAAFDAFIPGSSV
jgi:lysophospholipase